MLQQLNTVNIDNTQVGPLWTGSLWDSKLAAAIAKNSDDKFLKIIEDESKIKAFGFYDTHTSAKKLKISVPKLDAVIVALRKKGFDAARTHLNGNGIRTDATASLFATLVKKA